MSSIDGQHGAKTPRTDRRFPRNKTPILIVKQPEGLLGHYQVTLNSEVLGSGVSREEALKQAFAALGRAGKSTRRSDYFIQ